MKFIFIFLISVNTLALGGMDSGGGRSVVCFHSDETYRLVKKNLGAIAKDQLADISMIETLDLYYAKKPTGLDRKRPKLLESENFENDLALYDFVLQRLSKNLPELYHLIKEAETSFHKTEIIWEDQPIEPISDEKTAVIISRNNCLATTMAIQYKYQGLDFLHIDRELYEHELHSKLSQTTLLLHEFIYLAARNKGHVDSRSVRKVIRHLIRSDETIDYKVLQELAQSLGLI